MRTKTIKGKLNRLEAGLPAAQPETAEQQAARVYKLITDFLALGYVVPADNNRLAIGPLMDPQCQPFYDQAATVVTVWNEGVAPLIGQV
jgi:hypothetical protein